MHTLESNNNKVLLQVHDLVKYFPIRGGLLQRTLGHVKAVDGISFDIRHGETFGLVGESGCGKSSAGLTILRLHKPTRGRVLGEQLAEPLEVHGVKSRHEREERLREMLALVGLRPQYARRYPHEFSGGQRQRIAIARALILRPKFVVCDEPVSALDVSVQSQVLNLLRELQVTLGLTYLFISHNLAVVKYISDRVAVMYVGKVVELAPSKELYAQPLHPYTKALISAIPQPDPTRKHRRTVITGDVPSPAKPPPGCRFHTRCPLGKPACAELEPELREISGGHFVACHSV